MSRSRELKQHILKLEDIREIINSMKNLAFMEMNKLTRLLEIQQQIVKNIETTALDFLDFHPYPPPQPDKAFTIYVLLGSERGFCRDFNEVLLAEKEFEKPSILIAVGRKLSSRMETHPDVAAFIDGPNVAEEVPNVLNRLISTINQMQVKHGSIMLTAVYHDNEKNRILEKPLLPPFQRRRQKSASDLHPPVLNLEPSEFFSKLIDHYLFAVLHEIFYISLMAENQNRFRHMEGAVRHLDDETAKLKRESNIFRQEEITEEIEVILLNADRLAGEST